MHAPTTAQHIALDTREHAPAFAQAFPAMAPAWPSACHHSPDLMFAARNEAAFAAGDWFAVLGELHLTGNSLLQQPLLDLHPDAAAMANAYRADVTAREYVPQRPLADSGQRLHYDPPHAQAFQVTYAGSCRDPGPAIPIAELAVHRRGSAYVLLDRDGRPLAPLMHFLGPQLRSLCVNAFRPLAPRPHTPRVSLGRLVVSRESWQVPLADITQEAGPTSRANYRALRALQTRFGLPDRVFVRFPQERKPIYYDFHNPLLNHVLLPLVRAAVTSGATCVTMSEMLPDPAMCWLRDAAGERYSMEMRVIAYDRTSRET